MQLGWIRNSGAKTAPMPSDQMSNYVAQADALGFSQLWLPEFTLDRIDATPRPDHVRLGFTLPTGTNHAPRQLADQIRAGQTALAEKFLVGLTLGDTPKDRVAFEKIETLLSQDPRNVLPSDFPMAKPRAEVLLQSAPGTSLDLMRGANAGFSLMSPAWQTPEALARHWAAIVAGSTHAARRAKPSQWHVARLIYVSDDDAEIDQFWNGPAREFLKSHSPEGWINGVHGLVIAGNAPEVAGKVAALRRCIGPFETLQILDPGLPHEQSLRQMARIATEVLPLLRSEDIKKPQKEMETT